MSGGVVESGVRWLGAVLFVATGFFYLAAGLLAPLWAVAVLWVVWIALGILLVRRWRGSLQGIMLIPAAAILFWLAVMWLGDKFLDWTA